MYFVYLVRKFMGDDEVTWQKPNSWKKQEGYVSGTYYSPCMVS